MPESKVWTAEVETAFRQLKLLVCTCEEGQFCPRRKVVKVAEDFSRRLAAENEAKDAEIRGLKKRAKAWKEDYEGNDIP